MAPGRGHVKDTTALLWEETVIIFAIVTTERNQFVACCLSNKQQTCHDKHYHDKHSETQTNCNLSDPQSNSHKIRYHETRTKITGSLLSAKKKNQTTPVPPSPLGAKRDFHVSALCVVCRFKYLTILQLARHHFFPE